MIWDVLIIGGGPAGSTAAAELARRGYRVGVLDRATFPRAKLCGEFLAPSGVALLERQGLLEAALRAGARPVREAVFVSARGSRYRIPLNRFPEGRGFGLGISRAALDQLLLQHARALGADVLEGAFVTDSISRRGRTIGVTARMRPSGQCAALCAPIIIDASGRARALSARSPCSIGEGRSRLFAFQLHVSGVEGLDDAVELYFYPSGYGGLVRIENDLYNLCALTTREVMRRAGNHLERLLTLTLRQNPVARERLRGARPEGPLRGCGPLDFGPRALPCDHLAIGDAAAQVDPFMGQGISMALESGLLAAELVEATFREGDLTRLASRYNQAFRRRFARRWRAAAGLRLATGEVNDWVLRWLPERARLQRLILRGIFGERMHAGDSSA